MPAIQITLATSTGLTSVWDKIQSVQLGSPLDDGEGAFGEVFNCLGINGSPAPIPLVIKIFKQDSVGNYKRGYATIRKLQERIWKKNKELNQSGRSIAEIPGLYALPQFSFEGVLGNKNVFGYAAIKLDSSLFCSFDEILQNRFPEFRGLDLNRKLQLSLDLAESFAILREINYIHADINPKNLFVSLKDGHLVLIDYDSGVVVDHPNDVPTTWGKPDEWVPPEVLEQLAISSSAGQSVVKVDLFTDTWSVAIGIHYFLFCRSPYFFLKVAGPNEIKEYVDSFHWPAVDWGRKNFNTRQRKIYADYQRNIGAVDSSIKRAIETTFSEGVGKRHMRTSYVQWVQLLKPRVKEIPFAARKSNPLPLTPSSQPPKPQTVANPPTRAASVAQVIHAPAKNHTPTQPLGPSAQRGSRSAPGISKNAKIAIGVTLVAILVWASSSHNNSATPAQKAKVELINEGCEPYDFVLNNRKVVRILAGQTIELTVDAGNYTAKVCAIGSSSCSPAQEVTWRAGMLKHTISPSPECVAQRAAAQKAQEEAAKESTTPTHIEGAVTSIEYGSPTVVVGNTPISIMGISSFNNQDTGPLQFQKILHDRIGNIDCVLMSQGEYTCSYQDYKYGTKDFALVALSYGAAEVADGAPQKYRDAQAYAQTNRLGRWGTNQ